MAILIGKVKAEVFSKVRGASREQFFATCCFAPEPSRARTMNMRGMTASLHWNGMRRGGRYGLLYSEPFGSGYGLNLLMNVDQLPRAVRPPGPWPAPAHVPSKLSPFPPVKNGPPQSAYAQS